MISNFAAKRKFKRIEGDSSLMTYRGHSVLHTLIRSRFSPEFTTGQRYIYSGCATGAVIGKGINVLFSLELLHCLESCTFGYFTRF